MQFLTYFKVKRSFINVKIFSGVLHSLSFCRTFFSCWSAILREDSGIAQIQLPKLFANNPYAKKLPESVFLFSKKILIFVAFNY